jgi:hypothetical protein
MAVRADNYDTRPAVPKPTPQTPATTPVVTDTPLTVEEQQAKIAADAKKAQLAAEARADAKQKAANLKTAKRYGQASTDLQSQITALKDAIRNEFARGRRQNIGDLDMQLKQLLGQIKEGAVLRGAGYLEDAADTEKATGDKQDEGFRNLVRERADSMTAILEQGAGETDALRAMLMNARNWHANASDASRTYYDSMGSINKSITDLNVDTKTALSNAHMTNEGQKEQVWQDFYNRRAEGMTALGNTYGKRVEYLEQAKELGLGMKGTPTKQLTSSRKGMKKQFAGASNELGKSYVQKPLPDWIEGWEGTPQQERRQENTNLAAAPQMESVQKAQGASLRKWAA